MATTSMAKVEKRLKETGRYEHFRARWKWIQGTTGKSGKQAYNQAIEEYTAIADSEIVDREGAILELADAGEAVVPDLRNMRKEMAAARKGNASNLNVDGSTDKRRGTSPNPFLDDEGKLKEIGQRDSIKWVAANLELKECKPKDCPSSETWGLYKWARACDENKSEFWRLLYPKLLPSRAQIGKAEDEELGDSLGEEALEGIESALDSV